MEDYLEYCAMMQAEALGEDINKLSKSELGIEEPTSTPKLKHDENIFYHGFERRSTAKARFFNGINETAGKAVWVPKAAIREQTSEYVIYANWADLKWITPT